MKYPQLVSTRAVNAISDWLVSRLEQLGVEAPQIYTRLLLSLLQTSVQINDPIEFNSLETFIENRKGGSIRRYLQCDANTLKKLNAVQCLSEIVSSEQELTTIENLVEELWEKLKDIEKQLDYNHGDDVNFADCSASVTDIVKTKANIKDNLKECANATLINCSINNNSNNYNEKRTIVSRDITKIELETDPKKRYFNAFPALSKEMEESFRIWRRNAKSLTWPADRGNLLVSSSSAMKYSSVLESKDNEKSAKTNDKSNDMKLNQVANSLSHTPSNGSLKRKTKRRKSQSTSKGRTIPNSRNTTFNDNVENALSATGAAGTNRRSNRHMSPTEWDTDFDGYWEMGHDLIKEFFAKQRNTDLSRSNSTISDQQTEIRAKIMHGVTKNNLLDEKLTSDEKCSTRKSPLTPPVDISFCCDDSFDDDDTYKSISGLNVDSLQKNFKSNPRRLYQRLVLPDNDVDVDSTTNDVQLDFMQFKTKFNNNLAALWQNTSDDENTYNDELSLWSAPNNIPWPAVAPIKENLKNFWANYYNHQFDIKRVSQEQDKLTREILQGNANKEIFSDMDENGCMSLPFAVSSTSSNASGKVNRIVKFHSMSHNVEDLEKTREDLENNNGSKTRNGRSTPIGVFLQDSIWSENLNGGKNTDSDESFYLKVWNSNKKLCNLDAIYEKKVTENNNESSANNTDYQFPTYVTSKWSEGINAGPNGLQQQESEQFSISRKNEIFNQQNVSSVDCVDASISTTSCSSSSHTLSSSGVVSGQTPSLQLSFQLLTSENVKPLTEFYGGINSPNHADDLKAIVESEKASPVSLSNHSSDYSGFVEYSRIKSVSHTLMMETIKQQQRHYQSEFPRLNEQRYLDDENLLTSDRTHFQPIRAYADGYTFDVCSALEVINYNRSDSGYLYFESDKYLEYTRKDIFMAEEENNSAVASAAPLYAGSNCDAALTQNRQKERKVDELVLKFRVMNNEIACQTDDETTKNSMYTSAQLQHPLYLIFSGADSVPIPTDGQERNDTIEAINKVVVATAKAERDRMYLGNPWLRLNEVIDVSRNTMDPSLIWTEVQASSREEASIDEIDFYNESACVFGNTMDEQWSMSEIEKRCQLNSGACLMEAQDVSHMTGTNTENKNLNGNQQNNADMHSLWGMCTACNSDSKSAPADNLLRDELKLEADQIMSDLKQMQDLYIGCNIATQGGYDNDCCNDNFWGRYCTDNHKMPKNLKHPCPVSIHGQRAEEIKDIGDKSMHDLEDGIQLRRRETQQKVLQQVNKLIADLMRPEKANDTNILADAAASAHRELGESLWPDDGKHNIWKQQRESCNLNETQYEGSSSTASVRTSHNSVLAAEDNKFLAQLTWEHDNLAELWAKGTPVLQSKQTPPQQQKETQPLTFLPSPKKPPVSLCSSPTYACMKQRRAGKVIEGVRHNTNYTSNTIVTNSPSKLSNELKKPKCASVSDTDNDNDKHPSRCNDVLVAANNATYKRLQQFLNSAGITNSMTSAKLKLANRKRRHSASQNYATFHNSGLNDGKTVCVPYQKLNNSSNNNNNNKISDLNNSSFKRFESGEITSNSLIIGDEKGRFESATNNTEDVDMLEEMDNSAAYFLLKNGNSMLLPPTKQTIITCKYWTTINPMMDTDGVECSEGTTFSCLVDKNDTILKHVAVLTRPLTR